MQKQLILTTTGIVLVILLVLGVVGAHYFPSGETLIVASDGYNDGGMVTAGAQLANRIHLQPFNILAFIVFLCAILHTFVAHKITEVAHHISDSNQIASRLLHFLGEIEIVFGIWALPLFLLIASWYSWETAVHYIDSRDYTEPLFVLVVMALTSTYPIIRFAESCLHGLAGMFRGSATAWWWILLTIGPILGSFITEPAAMTLTALLLARHVYSLQPSAKLSYATLGLLFTNISVGGVLTHFAAPPVLMVAKKWSWDTSYMFHQFGIKAIIGIVLANALYWIFFRKELASLTPKPSLSQDEAQSSKAVPFWITAAHLGFLAWTIVHSHYPSMFLGGFMLFLGFYQATMHYQNALSLKSPILVAFFLAGLVVHTGLQGWWLEPILTRASELPLFLSAIGLTAVTDNAALTSLTAQVPNFSDSLKYVVVAGAVTGGGLTVIANAPNPAGQSILQRFFKDGISPAGLFLAALLPTVILALSFYFIH